MSNAARTHTKRIPQGPRLGDRVRQLRVSAGLTQTELAGSRFSKEYVSQIERGKTRPTRETVEWLPPQLGVDPRVLPNGGPVDQRGRLRARRPPPRAPPARGGNRNACCTRNPT